MARAQSPIAKFCLFEYFQPLTLSAKLNYSHGDDDTDDVPVNFTGLILNGWKVPCSSDVFLCVEC